MNDIAAKHYESSHLNHTHMLPRIGMTGLPDVAAVSTAYYSPNAGPKSFKAPRYRTVAIAWRAAFTRQKASNSHDSIRPSAKYGQGPVGQPKARK